MSHAAVTAEPVQHAQALPPLFEARGISKSFDEVIANQDVSLTVMANEKHALLGENGAGKSTLVKMIDGVLQPDSGSFFWNGQRIDIDNPAAARRLGIGMVFQHFSTFDALTAAENIALALPGESLGSIRKNIRETAAEFGLAIDPDRRVERLSAGEKQRVEIVRCLLQKPKLLILDEPTSVLTPQEATALFATLDRLAASGVAIIYISHRLEEIRAFCDRATILRRGKVVAACDPKMETAASMAELMIGDTATPILKTDVYIGRPRLEIVDLSVAVQEGVPLSKISFSARKGEILGIAGVAGEGQDCLFEALSGERRTANAKAIRIEGKPAGTLGPQRRRRLGAAFAPEQRLDHAAVGELPLSENVRLTRLHRRSSGRRSLRQTVSDIRAAYDVRGGRNDPKAATLSGGNLQKFVIGRELDRKPKLFVAAQPTWGVDAGAAVTIRTALAEMAQRGGAVVIISQDLDEIFQICDRVAVMHRGKLSETFNIGDMTPEKIGLLMAGADADSLDDESSAPSEPSPARLTAHAAAESAQKQPSPVVTPTQAADFDPSQRQQAAIGTVSGTVTTPWTPVQPFQRNGPG